MKIMLFCLLVLITSCRTNNEIVDKPTPIPYGDGKYNWQSIEKKYGSRFNYLYRIPFNNRWADNEYILCYFLSIEKVYDTFPDLGFEKELNPSAKIALIKIKAFEEYITPEWTTKYTYFWSEAVEEEYLGKNDYGFVKWLSNYHNYENEFLNNAKYLHLLVVDNELIVLKRLLIDVI